MFAISFGAASILVVCFAGSASALVREHFFSELPSVGQKATIDFLYEQSPQPTVPYGGEASEIATDVSHTYESETKAAPFYDDLAAGTSTVEESAGLMPEVFTAIPTIAAAGTAFAVGWEIGEGINAIFAEIGLGFGSAPELTGEARWRFCYSASCIGRLRWHSYGEPIYYAATVQQKPGAYLYSASEYEYGAYSGYDSTVDWFESPCPFSGFTSPPDASLEQGLSGAPAECWFGSKSAPVKVDYPYTTPARLLGHEEFHPYDPLIDGKPGVTSKAPDDPGTAVVEERVEQALGESELLQDFITENEEPEPSHEYFPAPAATEKKVDDEERRCDRGTPTFDNLGGNGSPEPFATVESTPFTVTSLPSGIESPSPVYLRWGEAEWQGEQREEPQNMDAWGGWGYRHIRAKHGWNALDRLETEEALARPQVPIQEGTKWLYTAVDPAAGIEGVECERQVYVQFRPGTNPKTEKEDPAPRGIVTSYNIVR